MKISVITPTFNSAATIEESAVSAAEQNYADMEHIFIDNESSDNTFGIIESIYKNRNRHNVFRWISEKDRGISHAFNKGIALATGEIICILNADDRFLNNSLFADVEAIFQKNKNILFVHGDIIFCDELFGTNLRKPLLCDVRKAMPFNHPGMFIRASVYSTLGGYSEEYRYAMDFEFICRLDAQLKNLEEHGYYFGNYPVCMMVAGGASWKNEVQGVNEAAMALKHHGQWDVSAGKYFLLRLVRLRTKPWLVRLGLTKLIHLWRNWKWN